MPATGNNIDKDPEKRQSILLEKAKMIEYGQSTELRSENVAKNKNKRQGKGQITQSFENKWGLDLTIKITRVHRHKVLVKSLTLS